MSKKLKMIWKGKKEYRKEINGDGFSASLHFVPEQIIILPEELLTKLKDEVASSRLVLLEEETKEKLDTEENGEKDYSYNKRFRRRKESSITDSDEEV